MHKALIVLVLAAAAFNPAPQGTPLADVIADISRFRRAAFDDTTRINFCSVGEAFDANGRFIAPRGAPPARFGSLEACRAAAGTRETTRNVVIKSITRVGDTVLVRGWTDRIGLRLAEEYRYFPDAQGRLSRVYSITGVFSE